MFACFHFAKILIKLGGLSYCNECISVGLMVRQEGQEVSLVGVRSYMVLAQ